MVCYTIIQCKNYSKTTIQCKYYRVLILRAGQLGALVKYTSRLENKLVSNQTNLIRTSNKLGLGFTVVYNLNGGHYLNVRYSVPPVSQKRFQCEWKVKNVPLPTKLEIGKLKKNVSWLWNVTNNSQFHISVFELVKSKSCSISWTEISSPSRQLFLPSTRNNCFVSSRS